MPQESAQPAAPQGPASPSTQRDAESAQASSEVLGVFMQCGNERLVMHFLRL